MEFFDFGWRDVLLIGVALAAIYLVIALLGLARLQRRNAEPPVAASMAAPMAATMTAPMTAFSAPPPVEPELTSEAEPAPFAGHLALSGLEVEVRRLSAEVASLREELAKLKAAPQMTPWYADAAALARRGFDARGVAAECGISVAEAELVLAMSRGDKDFDSEVDDAGHGYDAAAELSGR